MAIKPSILSNSYVKFVRTNLEMWNALQTRDNDTLYFVVEQGASNGSLYLGNALIATSIDGGLRLEDLIDIAFAGDVKADEVLVFDGSNWVNKNIYDFMPVTMTGATAEQDGLGGLVPVPVAGKQDKYLRGDGTWEDPTAALSGTVGKLSESLDNTIADLETVIGSDAGSSMRAVATDVTNAAITSLVNNAPEAFDTLKEIADWIAAHPESVTALNAAITNEANRAKAAEKANTDAIDALEALVGDVAVATQIANAIADANLSQYALASELTALSTQLSNLKGTGSRLITTDEIAKLAKLVMGEDGSVSMSGSIAAGNVQGLSAAIDDRIAIQIVPLTTAEIQDACK